MKLELFDFNLPTECIAQQPAEPRDSARLLEVGRTHFAGHVMRDLPSLLRKGDVLVFNNSKVIPARLKGTRIDAAHGGIDVEILLHKPVGAPNYAAPTSEYHCFARPARRLKPGHLVRFADDFHATVLGRSEQGEVTLRFDAKGRSFFEALEAYGEPPLPPYIARPEGASKDDKARYQTIYAKHEGSVAAPTAGLHYTPALMAALETAGVERAEVTLHVGAGTFQPVKVEDTDEHVMHHEYGQLDASTAERINHAKGEGRRVFAVGTTAMRVLESAANSDGTLQPFQQETDIFITPGYPFKIVDGLLTNFHLPKSTLFMLVSAFSGLERMHRAYEYAIANGFRFYSYGDCCLLMREDLL